MSNVAARPIASTVTPGSPMVAATAIRASVLVTSRLAIRGLGRDDDYFARLDPAHHEAIRELSGVGWAPIELADAHYAAADALGLGAGEQREIGRQVAQRLRDSFAGAIIRSLRTLGALSARSLITRLPTAWERLVEGGGAHVFDLGPNEVRVECLRTSIARYRYVREGWAGMFEGTLSLVSSSVEVDSLREHIGHDRCAFRIAWT